MHPYYQGDDALIYHGRCEEAMSEITPGSVDLIFTSPPYNLGNTTGGGVGQLGHYRKTDGMKKRGGRRSHWDHAAIANGYDGYNDDLPHEEYVLQQQAALRQMWGLLANDGAIFYNHKPRILSGRAILPTAYLPSELLPQVRQVIIWKRSGGINFTEAFYCPMHEWIVLIAKNRFRLRDKAASGAGDVWTVHQERDNDHPAPFPIGLPTRAIETTNARMILDPYMGSGTTIRAAINCGRKTIGIDSSAMYCDMAIKRLSQRVLC